MMLRLELEAPLAPPTSRLVLTWFLDLALGLAGLAVFVEASGLLVRSAGMVASTAGFVALATLGHTASHRSFSGSRWVDQVFYHLSYPLLLMVSARYWLHSHVHTHHAAPNVVGVDPDCDLRPAFAIHTAHRRGETWVSRQRDRFQGFALPLILPFNGFNIQRQGWVRLVAELRDPRRRGLAVWLDLGCMLGHLVLFLGLPMLWWDPADVLAVHALRVMLIGVALFAILAPGHFPAEAVCLDRGERHAADFFLRQTVTTVDFRTGPLGRWLCSGLEFQIEHHLFPHINHVHLPRVRDAVRELCARHGLPHRTLGWGEAIWKSYRVFFTPKPVVTDVQTHLGRAPSAGPLAEGPS